MPEFDTLIALLEEDKPAIDPGYARRLDQRVADGFRKPPRRRPRIALRFVALPATALAVAAIVVAARPEDHSRSLSRPFSSGGAATSAAPAAPAAPQQESRTAAPAGAMGGRVQEQTAGITLTAPAKDLAGVGDQVVAVADGVGGFVASSSVSTSTGGSYALRVPVDRLGDALARLSKLGHVQERTQGSQDITAERNSARDRLREALAERRSLLTRLASATTDNEVTSLKARLRDVSGAIAGARTSLRGVERRARFASLQVTLQPRTAATAPGDDGRWTPGDALRDAGRVLEVVAGVVVVAGSILVPLALLIALGIAGRRLAARRGRGRMLETV